MSKYGTRGPDVCLTAGELQTPSKIRFVSVSVGWLQWKELFGYDWERIAHIKELEVRAFFVQRIAWGLDTGTARLLRSAGRLSEQAEQRTSAGSAHQLIRVVQRYDALKLASFCRPYFCYVRSHEDPAGKPSRRQRRRPPTRR